ncbi:hypothetical protein LCGC14_2096080, partial [marine sediment metagenome]
QVILAIIGIGFVIMLVSSLSRPGLAAEFSLTIVGRYQVLRPGLESGHHKGPYVLIRRISPTMTAILLDGVERYAVHDKVIFGETDVGYFVLDTGATDHPDGELNLFENQLDWRAALRKKGVEGPLQLLDPLRVAATRPAKELRPEDYRRMNALLGLPDGGWSGLVLLCGAAISMLRGMFCKRTLGFVPFAVFIGLAAFQHAMFLSLSEGPSLCGMVVMIPVMYVACGYFGRWLIRVYTLRKWASLHKA